MDRKEIRSMLGIADDLPCDDARLRAELRVYFERDKEGKQIGGLFRTLAETDTEGVISIFLDAQYSAAECLRKRVKTPLL